MAAASALAPVALIGAMVLSVAQAWALGATRRVAWRYVLAGALSFAILLAPILFLLGFPWGNHPVHREVAWTGAVLSITITAAAFSMAERRRSRGELHELKLVQRVRALFPRHLTMLWACGTVEYIGLGMMISNEIH